MALGPLYSYLLSGDCPACPKECRLIHDQAPIDSGTDSVERRVIFVCLVPSVQHRRNCCLVDSFSSARSKALLATDLDHLPQASMEGGRTDHNCWPPRGASVSES
eukprot:Gregarina_sp_Poly_1__9015@NODE_54_length_17501_cov_44_565045_g46_i0_p13_GENE_NODE_54_length_17501_cov_44_565045_g46_i0NODE_54_length_17501_cov_44_565045_g46_i0_p13_ORF_typecomplete_len105_score4_26KASH/PF10541_9/0_026_NODE_54_length_17501_cov_44_565045_g46_i061696483